MPEYRTYVPPEHATAYKDFVAGLNGAKTISSLVVIADFRLKEPQVHTREESIRIVKDALNQLPADTQLRQLAMWNYDNRFLRQEGVEVPIDWMKTMCSLQRSEMSAMSRAISNATRALQYSLGPNGATLAAARTKDWTEAEQVRGIGKQSIYILQRIFAR